MMIYMSASGTKKNDLAKSFGFGLVYSPYYPLTERTDIPYILDNGAFTAYSKGIDWDEGLFYRSVKKYPNYDFVVIPDIVAWGESSLKLSIEHADRLDHPRYLAVQNGISGGDCLKMIPHIDGIFVGGDMIWKLREAEYWCNYAHKNGLKCHIGRVGTKKMYDWAMQCGADSVDGSTPMRHDTIHLVPEWIDFGLKQTRIGAF
jgi:hypothetical protein